MADRTFAARGPAVSGAPVSALYTLMSEDGQNVADSALSPQPVVALAVQQRCPVRSPWNGGWTHAPRGWHRSAAIVSPAYMSTFSKAAPFIDAPFLFRDLAHWNKVLDADTLKPVADEIAAASPTR